jgi:superfamily II DNA helicase RecQ
MLYAELRAWRLKIAQEIDKPPFVVFHDAVLKRIAAHYPATQDELLAIKGIGPRKLEQFGQAVLAVVASHKSSRAGETP